MSEDNGYRSSLGLGLRWGTELIAATLIGSVMGYAFDKFFDTSPWLLVLGVLFGGAAGCLNVYRCAQELEDNNIDDEPDI